ncbi:hypothetical protein GCM10022415_12890 [Knoellia locipacati]|uniref:Lipoprotein n=1 Tax=Knoellia locipacati TaxID=882824 RepID=A0A512SZ58_9MICO|nr:hypothetical protein [Knoellia locipacati]GEQ13239.1 hypothetical protein KLO01_12860 [Knoellia locipacati]
MLKPWVPLATVLSLALTACGVLEGPPTRPAGSAVSSSTAAGSPSTAPTPTPDLPAGHAWQTVDEVSVTFAVPETWTAMNPKKLLEGGDTSAFDEMASKMGVTSRQMMQAVGNADLLMLAPPRSGYADNISGLVVPLEGLPTDAQLMAELGKVSEAPVVVTPGESPAGPTISADYSLQVSGRTVTGRSLFVETQDGVLNLSVSALDPATTKAVAETIASTMHPA